ncbi:MAG: UTP--glucose-1-phosphate uridylyltransferase [Phycisphaeraceae bacterium]|nr:UTP--glucose-1-phosphate uridylyltransferase [Phycisphaeraceae bacterium]
MSKPLSERYQQALRTLESIDQAQVFRFYEQLNDQQRDQLLTQVENIDWPEVARLVETHVKRTPALNLPKNVQPAPYYPCQPTSELKPRYQQARSLGEQLIREGKVAAFIVAGGQGTRLGWDGPKGTFPATPIRKLSLFGCFAEYLIALNIRFGVSIPWYVMTSLVNDADTRAFFAAQNYFGLNRQDVFIFPQAMMPAMDMATAKVLLADRDSLALSPNGHGGSLKALHTSGALKDMAQRGIEQISYVQVDNPIVRVVDPLFLGLHALDSAQMSSKMLPKCEPFEKLGNFCLINGQVTVIEYSNLPQELAVQRLDNGDLRFRAGSIALHAIRVDFVRKLNEAPGGFALPFNRAEKKVPFVDLQTGEMVSPQKPNAIKLETFVFDALPMAQTSIIYETSRDDEFAPIKNATAPGAVDSPATSTAMQIDRARTWLRQAGVEVADDAVVEIKATTALYPEDLRQVKLPKSIGPGEIVLL